VRWTLVIIIILSIETYAFQSFKTLFKFNWISKVYLSINFLIYIFLFLSYLYLNYYSLNISDLFYDYLSIPMAFLITLLGFKLIICSFLFFEDIVRVLTFSVKFLFSFNDSNDIFIQRRQFVSKIALFLASIPLPFVVYGIFKGRYNYKVINYELEFEDLPEKFDGFQLTQISDIHCGSLKNSEEVEYAVNLINKQKSDLVLFTGDFVNSKANELIKWKDVFSKIEASCGKYSILGNHDYGDYVSWDTKDEKKKNFNQLLNLQKEMGFKMLLNENVKISKEKQSINIIGVENWGKGGFKKNGDIDKACQGLNNESFKIVMTHDPSHWEKKLLNHQTHFHLTLSGHTHGMQFGIEIPGWIKWSPIKWAYKYWAGLYLEKGQYLNVNRGFGVLAFPGRVGIWPEITVIKLKKI
tara:strand:- start:6260 stop:7492 length:1233 start_codon:yes stop_codon:yes gene_type:complete